MQKEQKTSTKVFKIEALRLLEASQKSQAQMARELGVADSTLSQWRKDLAEHSQDAFRGPRSSSSIGRSESPFEAERRSSAPGARHP